MRSILSKLDGARSASRGGGRGPASQPQTSPHPAESVPETPMDGDTLIGAPKAKAQTATIKPPASSQDPDRPGAQFGRAKPIPFRQ